MKGPAKPAGAYIEGANVSGRGGVGLRIPAPDNDQILIDDAGTGEVYRLREVVSPQILPQIDSSLFAKTEDGFAGVCIERIEVMRHASQHAAVPAIRPIGNASRGLRAAYAGFEFP